MNKFKNLNKGFDLIIKFIFLIIIGFIIYTFYRSEILYDGQYREYYLKYYIFNFIFLYFTFFKPIKKRN